MFEGSLGLPHGGQTGLLWLTSWGERGTEIPDGLGSHGGMEETEGEVRERRGGEGMLSTEVNKFEANYPWQPCPPRRGDGWKNKKIISTQPQDGGSWYPAGNLPSPLPQLWGLGAGARENSRIKQDREVGRRVCEANRYKKTVRGRSLW